MESVVSDSEFSELMQKHIEELIIYAFSKEQHFGILCKIEDVYFEPDLPEDISNGFRPLTLFFLAGYTFETAHIEDDCLIFEAGFGADNYGSLVSVPLISVMQIVVDETPVFINLATAKPDSKPKENGDSKGVENSMASFLSNPENSKFVKK